jgi:hypothetical protein
LLFFGDAIAIACIGCEVFVAFSKLGKTDHPNLSIAIHRSAIAIFPYLHLLARSSNMFLISDRRTTDTDCINSTATQEFIMFQNTVSLESAFDKTATAFDFACTVADRLYWLDDNYVQPFYSWAAPRLSKVAINGLYWGLVSLIDIALWLIDTTRQFMARDAEAIAFSSFALAHAPLPKFPALAPAAVPLALPIVEAVEINEPAVKGMSVFGAAIRAGLDLVNQPTDDVPRIDAELKPGALMILPLLTTGVTGQVWNPVPTASTKTEDELASALDVPGAKGGTPSTKAEPKRSKAKGNTRNTVATTKGKGVKVRQ